MSTPNWPPPVVPSVSVAPDSDRPTVTIGAFPAALGWILAWLASNAVAAAVLVGYATATGHDLDAIPTWGTIAGLAAMWAVLAVALVVISRLAGTGNFRADYGLEFRPIDLLGIPAGFVAQFILIPFTYLPLMELWPDTFSSERLEQRSTELFDPSSGASLVVLVLMVTFGAPLFEELVYRGLLQRSFQRPITRWGAWVGVAFLFAIVHASPIEIPGLFVAGLTFGLGVVLTNRIGFGMLAHLTFNAMASILLVANR